MKVKLPLILIILIGLLQMINCDSKKQNKNSDSFNILFWDYKAELWREDLIKEIYQLSYEDLLKKGPNFVLSSKHIKKYYWDEQFLVVNWVELVKDGFIIAASGYFTVIFEKKIIYHGHDHTLVTAKIHPKDKSPYPAIQIEKINEIDSALILKPRFLDLNMTFKDYDKKEREKILNDDILKYFEKQGKIVRGYFDINEIRN